MEDGIYPGKYTYVDDFKWLSKGGRYYNEAAFKERQSLEGKGVITVMYPEEKLPVPERFRFIPFLITDDPAPGQTYGKDWCTSCGICAKVCPPQCIWIVRTVDPKTNKPVPQPAEFYIDADLCMNCGFCAEFRWTSGGEWEVNRQITKEGRKRRDVEQTPVSSRVRIFTGCGIFGASGCGADYL